MPPTRKLPAHRNQLLSQNIPSYDDLVARRRLGQTQLTARMVTASPDAEIDPMTLGSFDYAHLRAPLPKGIVSGIFKTKSPNSYFLMRRSSDGYVSATGMFKATFPYARADDEDQERRYLKSLGSTSTDELAGNIWIPPQEALKLAREYHIEPWIDALLDPAEITSTNGADSSSPVKTIAPPPAFRDVLTADASSPVKTIAPPPAFRDVLTADSSSPFETIAPPPAFRDALTPPTPSPSHRATAASSRSRRSMSPCKPSATLKHATASPRKRCVGPVQPSIETPPSSTQESSISSPVSTASASVSMSTTRIEGLSDVVQFEACTQDTIAVLPSVDEAGPKITVHLEDIQGDEKYKQVKHTMVDLELPCAGQPPSAEEAAAMIAEAKAIVEATKASDTEEAVDSSAALAVVKNNNELAGKRKQHRISTYDNTERKEDSDRAGTAEPSAKRIKTEVDLRKAKMKKRAYLGIGAAIVLGAVASAAPLLMSAF